VQSARVTVDLQAIENRRGSDATLHGRDNRQGFQKLKKWGAGEQGLKSLQQIAN